VREAQKGLVTSDKMHASLRKESNDMKKTNSATNIRRFVNRLHVPIVLVLSLFHVGLACLHNRDSGRVDHIRAEPVASSDARKNARG
jgi:cell division protein FtsB